MFLFPSTGPSGHISSMGCNICYIGTAASQKLVEELRPYSIKEYVPTQSLIVNILWRLQKQWLVGYASCGLSSNHHFGTD